MTIAPLMILFRIVYGDDMTTVPADAVIPPPTVTLLPTVTLPLVSKAMLVVADEAFWMLVVLRVDIVFPYAVYVPDAVNLIMVLEPEVVIVGDPVVTPE
jgi:hypothetical protein